MLQKTKQENDWNIKNKVEKNKTGEHLYWLWFKKKLVYMIYIEFIQTFKNIKTSRDKWSTDVNIQFTYEEIMWIIYL